MSSASAFKKLELIREQMSRHQTIITKIVNEQPESDCDKLKLTYIDDNEAQLVTVKYILENYDPCFEVTITTSPEKALETCDKAHCVLSDYNMPKMDGVELAQKVKEYHDIPFILYTNQNNEALAQQAFKAGIDDIYRKEDRPDHLYILSNRIKKIVRDHHKEKLLLNIIEE